MSTTPRPAAGRVGERPGRIGPRLRDPARASGTIGIDLLPTRPWMWWPMPSTSWRRFLTLRPHRLLAPLLRAPRQPRGPDPRPRPDRGPRAPCTSSCRTSPTRIAPTPRTVAVRPLHLLLPQRRPAVPAKGAQLFRHLRLRPHRRRMIFKAKRPTTPATREQGDPAPRQRPPRQPETFEYRWSSLWPCYELEFTLIRR